MKKTLLLAVFGIFSLAGFAQTSKIYTDNLVVSIDGVSTDSQPTSVQFINNEDTCGFILKNFMLGSDVPVGNMELLELELKEGENGVKTFSVDRDIQIAAGDDPSLEWLGPMLGDVPIKLDGKITEDKLYFTIDIDLALLGQVIHVTFGQDIVTGIADMEVTANGKTDVYTLDGICVRRQVALKDALNGVKPGIYVVNGEKVIKK